jgi:hypothetical protein
MGAVIDVTTIRHATSFEARFKTFQVALDSSYPTGGYAIDPKDLGLAEILFFMAAPKSGYIFSFDHDNRKLMAYRTGGASAGTSGATSGGTPAGSVAAPVFSGAALSNFTPEGTVDAGTHAFTGTPATPGTPAGTNTAPAFSGSALGTHTHTVPALSVAAMVEVANGVNLATVTGVRCIAVGY